MRLCLFAFIGSDNLGDEAIFQTVYRDLQSLSPSELTVLSQNPAKTRSLVRDANVRVVSARLARESLSAIRGCDVFVCGGGGIFQDQTSIYNPVRYLSRLQVAHAFSKRVFVYGVSVGPLRNPINRRLTGSVLSRAAYLTVRDEASRQELLRLGIPEDRVETTSDPVVNFASAGACSPPGPDRKHIVVCLRHWFDTIDWLPVSVVNRLHLRSHENTLLYKRFALGMASVLDHLATSLDATLTFLPFWGDRDTRVHRDVVDQMQRRDKCRVISEAQTPEAANAIIGGADLVIGMRLHSLIFAIANARPFFAIDYSKKVGDFIEEVLPGRVGMVSASPRDLEPAEVIAKLDRVAKSSPFDQHYCDRVAELKRRERANITRLRCFATTRRDDANGPATWSVRPEHERGRESTF